MTTILMMIRSLVIIMCVRYIRHHDYVWFICYCPSSLLLFSSHNYSVLVTDSNDNNTTVIRHGHETWICFVNILMKLMNCQRKGKN